MVFSLIFAESAFLWFYNFATEQALMRITEDLVDTMHAAVDGIDGDQLRELYAYGVAATATPMTLAIGNKSNGWRRCMMTSNHAMLYTYVAGDEPNELVFITSNGAMFDPPFGRPSRLGHRTRGPNLAGLANPTLQTDNRKLYPRARGLYSHRMKMSGGNGSPPSRR